MKPWTQKTLVEVLGRERLVIEHHGGIASYGSEEILIRSSYGTIRVQGSGLGLNCMSREQLCVTGRIDVLSLVGRERDGAVG